MHHELIAGERDERRAAAGFGGDIGDGADFVAIERGQCIGESQAVLQIAARAIDAQADPVYVPVADLAADERLDLTNFSRRDRSGNFDNHRSPIADERLILNDGLRRQRQAAGEGFVVRGEQFDETELAPFAAGEIGERAARHQCFVGNDGVVLLELFHVVAEDELGALVGFDFHQFDSAIEHRQGNCFGDRAASGGDLLVQADDPGLDLAAIFFVDARRRRFRRRGP